MTPLGAASNSTFFSSLGWGAWSVATQSMVPSARAARQAWRSASVRKGGFMRKRVS